MTGISYSPPPLGSSFFTIHQPALASGIPGSRAFTNALPQFAPRAVSTSIHIATSVIMGTKDNILDRIKCRLAGLNPNPTPTVDRAHRTLRVCKSCRIFFLEPMLPDDRKVIRKCRRHHPGKKTIHVLIQHIGLRGDDDVVETWTDAKANG